MLRANEIAIAGDAEKGSRQLIHIPHDFIVCSLFWYYQAAELKHSFPPTKYMIKPWYLLQHKNMKTKWDETISHRIAPLLANKHNDPAATFNSENC